MFPPKNHSIRIMGTGNRKMTKKLRRRQERGKEVLQDGRWKEFHAEY